MHHDLKTENVVLTSNNQIQLIDFGLAKIFDEGGNLASPYAGTPYYMSPEIIQGNKYSFPSEIWSFGIIVYELMTFKRPFDSNRKEVLITQICFQEPPVITLNYSPDLINVVKSMLIKDPFMRAKLKSIIKHPTLWNFHEEEDIEQKKIAEKLQTEIKN